MPDHVINEVLFRDLPPGMVDEILGKTLNENLRVDFRLLVPWPNNIWCGTPGIIHQKTFPATRLDWAAKNWGTKWNAYDCERPEFTSDSLTLRFRTAWRPPYGWLVAVFNTFPVSFDHHWLFQGEGRAHSGVWRHGVPGIMGPMEWRETAADEATHLRMHVLLWGRESFNDDEDSDAGFPMTTLCGKCGKVVCDCVQTAMARPAADERCRCPECSFADSFNAMVVAALRQSPRNAIDRLVQEEIARPANEANRPNGLLSMLEERK